MGEADQDNEKKEAGSADRALMLWQSYLTGDHTHLDTMTRTVRRVFKSLPSETRCLVCNAPFQGLSGALVSLIGFRAGRSSFNPKLCDRCEKLVKHHQVGTEVQLSLLFADVRGSTPLAEKIGASAFHHLINRFYTASTTVLANTNALIDKLVGDEVAGLYLPGIAGPEYARIAVDAARDLLIATGHQDPGGPWIAVGAGVHTGTGYVGAVGSERNVSDITVLGDVANTTARLASQAGIGEILVSEETIQAAGLDLNDCESRVLQLKGRSRPISVRVIKLLQENVVT